MRFGKKTELENEVSKSVKRELSEEQKQKLKDILKIESFLAAVSFVLPFLMALMHVLVSNNTFEQIFISIYRFPILGAMMFFVMNSAAAYFYFKHRVSYNSFKEISVIALSILVTFIVSGIFSVYISAFIAPLCTIGLVVALLIDRKLALYVNILSVVAFYICYSTINIEFDISTILVAILAQAIGGCFLILLSKQVYTRMFFLINSVLVGACIVFPLAFVMGLLVPNFNAIVALRSGVWAFLSFILGLALFMVLLPIFEFVFKLYSNFRLDELCAPEAPLMARLSKEAPGTYNHSLAMANLAQACAMAIGENSTLARAGACYHDVGKLRNPICFTENQTSYNPHDDFIPEVSVSLITRHTHDGADLIRKLGLPESLAQIAEEHHGQTTVGFFLNKTRGFTDEQLANSDFSYKGPKPTTKISGLIMIVDTVEAATRAQGVDKDVRNFTAFIHRLIMNKMDSGQFSECPLTLKDLQIIEETLVNTLPNLYHQRIKYTK